MESIEINIYEIFYNAIIGLIQKPWKILFGVTLPYQSYPFLSFIVIITYFTLLSKYLIYSVDVFISFLKVSHTFVGLTFASWGGNISGNKKTNKKFQYKFRCSLCNSFC